MLKLKVVTTDGVIYDASDITSITLPGANDVLTIREDHEPLFTLLRPGEISIVRNGKQEELAVSTGMVEVRRGNEIYIAADTAERADAIDLERAMEAKERAEKYLNDPSLATEGEVDYVKLQAVIERENARIQIGKKYKDLRGVKRES